MKLTLIVLLLINSAITYSQDYATIKKATAFIYKKEISGNLIPNGTCFIIGKKLPTDSTKSAMLFVTARHVIEDSIGRLLKEFYIRMNTQDNNSRYIYFKTDSSNVFFHPNKSVDIAVFLFSPKKSDYDFKYIPDIMIPDWETFSSNNIKEGDEVFFCGLFLPYIGDQRIYPILRFGHISLITSEKIQWGNEKKELVLLEASSYGGNSGSPVYALIGNKMGDRSMVLLGIMTGMFRDFGEIAVINTDSKQMALYNNGISAITPSYLLYEIINLPQLISLLKK